jgi:hypothetical protein
MSEAADVKPKKKRRKRKATGRPRLSINIANLLRLSKLMCTETELAAFFDVSLKTMKRRLQEPELRDLWERGKALGLYSIRRQQFEHMKLPNSAGVQMTIHLSKFHLGQTEKSLIELTGRGGGPIQTVDLSKASDEQLAALEAIFGPLAVAARDDVGDQGGEGGAAAAA